MGTSAVVKGPASERVRANVRRLREEQRLSLQELADRVTGLGRAMQQSTVSKIEQGDRRVDVDDLMALALALDATPNTLLLPHEADHEEINLVSPVRAEARLAWEWACGETPAFRAGEVGTEREQRKWEDGWRRRNRPQEHARILDLGAEVIELRAAGKDETTIRDLLGPRLDASGVWLELFPDRAGSPGLVDLWLETGGRRPEISEDQTDGGDDGQH